jgi:hypothetical protein|tara:strand:- start:103 stop:393 length:291 start_codon:yes stop_codon:yes gene_type:complete
MSADTEKHSLRLSDGINGGLNMKWLILIMLTQGNPFTIDHKPFDTEDDCVAWVSDLSNVQELAMEVIAKVGFNNPVTGIYCITNQERKTYETIQKL